MDEAHPTDLLDLQHREHDALRILLDMLDEAATALLERPDEREESLLDVVCLLHYLGRAENHHLREERVLYPALAERGVDPDLLQRLQGQHQELWDLQQALRKQAVEGDVLTQAEDIAGLARRLSAGMRGHLHLEDTVLFPKALEVIPPEMWTELHERGRELPVRCLAPTRPGVA